MSNIFCIPNSPIKERFYIIPNFNGYGIGGALSRFRVFIPGIRDIQKHHPSRFGNRKGINTINRNRMDISAKFIGNFMISGIIKDAAGSPISDCLVKLFRDDVDLMILSTLTNSNGIFTFSLPNISYKQYYFTTERTDVVNMVGITSHLITPVQI